MKKFTLDSSSSSRVYPFVKWMIFHDGKDLVQIDAPLDDNRERSVDSAACCVRCRVRSTIITRVKTGRKPIQHSRVGRNPISISVINKTTRRTYSKLKNKEQQDVFTFVFPPWAATVARLPVHSSDFSPTKFGLNRMCGPYTLDSLVGT